MWLTRGYRSTVEEAIGNGVFDEQHDNMVLVKDIELYSLCEHHMLPFFGKAHVAYIPDGRSSGSPRSRASSRCSRAACRSRSGSPSRSPRRVQDSVAARRESAWSSRRTTCA